MPTPKSDQSPTPNSEPEFLFSPELVSMRQNQTEWICDIHAHENRDEAEKSSSKSRANHSGGHAKIQCWLIAGASLVVNTRFRG